MELNSAQLEAFFAVAKNMNFTRAAEQLHVTQSALSQRIAKLEDELGTTLFIRDRTSIRLTEAGELVLRYCQFNQSAETELLTKLKSSKEDLAGVLRVGGFSSINRSLVIPALKNVMIKNPRLSIQILTKEITEIPRLLTTSEAEYIFTTKKSLSTDIENVFLGYEDSVQVKLKKAPNVEIYLDHDENDTTTRDYFLQNKISFKPLTIRYLDDIYGLIDGVKNGYGKAILPLHLIQHESSLEIVEPKWVLKAPVYLQFFNQPFHRNVHSIFVDEVKAYFRDKLRQEK
ncbi:MAG: LysR family transcriptional regulator [Bdellovibrionaceae bacterium]|nr:LysR family transcriptional regulator [Pseudobdellovibrionaceae bacterium]